MNTKSIRRLDAQGRVILPSHIRKAMNLTESSVVEITMNEDSSVTIRPAEKRCCVCGEKANGPGVIVQAMNGQKFICKECADVIAYSAEKIKGGVRE